MVARLVTEAIQGALIAEKLDTINIVAQRLYQTGNFGRIIEYPPTPMVL